jgi:riboflavin synthase
MFTGIITHVGQVRAAWPAMAGRDARYEIVASLDMETLAIGASIACSGPCLTAVAKGPGWFAVEASAETLARTTMGAWLVGTAVNLERAMLAGAEFGGHFVTGHIDGVVTLLDRREENGSARMTFDLPSLLAPFVAEKGSIALDGVSLTVNEVARDHFGINAISHTLAATTLGSLKPSARLNVEVDVLARYVGRQLRLRGEH